MTDEQLIAWGIAHPIKVALMLMLFGAAWKIGGGLGQLAVGAVRTYFAMRAFQRTVRAANAAEKMKVVS